MIIHSWKLYAVVVSWLSFYIKFPKAERNISGLKFAHDLGEKNVIDYLICYLQNFLFFKLPAAAKIVNVQEGVSSILVIFTVHISNAYLGLFKTIVLANVFYLIGLVMFCIAVYVPSIGKTIVFVALFFLAVGINGRDFLLELFLSDQRRLRPSDPTVVEDEVHRVSWRPYIMLLLSTVVSLLLQYFIEGKLILIIAIAAVFAGCLCFLLGHPFYEETLLTGGRLGTIFRVFKAAILERNLKFPTKPSQFHVNERASITLTPSIPFLRWLDRAAILESSISNEELKTDNGRLCTVEKVKEVKSLLTMIPMWAPFLVYSIVGAAGNTFFFEQSSYTNKDFYLVVFVICQALASLIASDMGEILSKLRFLKTQQRVATLVRIGIGMLCSLFCCIVAWRVEKFRLSTVDTRSTVGMHVLWLTPQFVLLGCMEGFAEEGLNEFFKTQVSGSMRDYGPAFKEFILGIGKFINAIFIVIFKDWFGDDLESSHLDKYYKFLVWLSFINFFLFVSVAVWYGNQQVEKEYLIPIRDDREEIAEQDMTGNDGVTNGSIVVEELEPRAIWHGNQQVEKEYLIPILPRKSHSFPPQRSRFSTLQRFVTAIIRSNEKEA